MRKVMTCSAAAVLLALGSTQAVADNEGEMYAGGGIGFHSLGNFDDATGFQVFGGYNLGSELLGVDDMDFIIEGGFQDTGDFEGTGAFGQTTNFGSVSGVWGTALFEYNLNPQIALLGRAGLDFGDDDGFMFGIGGGYNVTDEIRARLELVERDNVSSTQLNVTYSF